MSLKHLKLPKITLCLFYAWGGGGAKASYRILGVTSKKPSLFKDIVQIEVDPLPPTLILTNLFLTKC